MFEKFNRNIERHIMYYKKGMASIQDLKDNNSNLSEIAYKLFREELIRDDEYDNITKELFKYSNFIIKELQKNK